MPHKRLLAAALTFIALLTGLSLWLISKGAPHSADARLRDGGSLRVGFAVEAPYAFLDAQGQVTGEAPAIFAHVAQQLGVQHIDWVRMDFANLLPALLLGSIDAVAAGMFVTPERQRVAIFSRPTASVRTSLIVRSGEPRVPLKPALADLPTARDMHWVTLHEAAENSLLSQAGVRPEQVTTVPQVGRGLRAVAEQQADAFVISSVTAWQQIAAHPGWALEARTLTDAPAGLPAFVFRQQDTALRDAVDEVLLTFLGSEEHLALVRSFGFTSDERPPDLP